VKSLEGVTRNSSRKKKLVVLEIHNISFLLPLLTFVMLYRTSIGNKNHRIETNSPLPLQTKPRRPPQTREFLHKETKIMPMQ